MLQELRIVFDCQSFLIVPGIAVEMYLANCSSQRNNALDYIVICYNYVQDFTIIIIMLFIVLRFLRRIVQWSLRCLIIRCVRVIHVPARIVVHRCHWCHRRLVFRWHRVVHADPLASPSVHHRGVLYVLAELRPERRSMSLSVPQYIVYNRA